MFATPIFRPRFGRRERPRFRAVLDGDAGAEPLVELGLDLLAGRGFAHPAHVDARDLDALGDDVALRAVIRVGARHHEDEQHHDAYGDDREKTWSASARLARRL